MNEKYNGWTNYATWRVNLEVLDGYCDNLAADGAEYNSIADLAEYLQEYAESVIFCTGTSEDNSLVANYAEAFVSNVNWYEIAELAATDYPKLIKA